MLWVIIFVVCFFVVLVLFSAIRISDERQFLDEYCVPLEIHTHYDQKEFKITAEWPEDGAPNPVRLDIYTRQWDPGGGKPHVRFLPHAILRVYKESGEVYDWYEY